jgi:hypothetical protein
MPVRTKSARMSSKKGSGFRSRVMAAVDRAGFSSKEMSKLERIIKEAEEREDVVAQGMATVLDLAGLPPDDFDELAGILRSAHENARNGRAPFTGETLGKLEGILKGRVSEGALARMEADLSKSNEELIGAVKDSIELKSGRTQKLKYTPRKS